MLNDQVSATRRPKSILVLAPPSTQVQVTLPFSSETSSKTVPLPPWLSSQMPFHFQLIVPVLSPSCALTGPPAQDAKAASNHTTWTRTIDRMIDLLIRVTEPSCGPRRLGPP